MAQVKDIIKRYNLPNTSKILDIASGAGNWAIAFKQCGFNNISAIDGDDYYASNFNKHNIEFVHSKLLPNTDRWLPWKDNTFDIILCFDFIEHIPNYDTLFKEIKRVLKQHGIVIMVTPDWKRQVDIFFDDPTHVRPFTIDSINKMFRYYNLEVLECRNFHIRKYFGITRLWKICNSLLYSGGSIICVGKKVNYTHGQI